MVGWEHDSVITLAKNPNYIDAAEVTVDTLKCYLSDDANNMLTNFKNGDWLMIDDVPTNEMAALAADYPTEYRVVGQIGTYYVNWNVNEEILPASSTLTGVEAEMARAFETLVTQNSVRRYQKNKREYLCRCVLPIIKRRTHWINRCQRRRKIHFYEYYYRKTDAG